MLADALTNQRTATAAADGEGLPTQPDGAERRAHLRLRADEVQLSAARLSSGAEIKLIDLSRGGAQFETDRRFLPNSSVSLRLLANDSTIVVHGRVVRSRIVRLDNGGLGYNVAIAFNELLQQVIDERSETSDDPSRPSMTQPEARTSSEGVAAPPEPTPPEIGSNVTAEECAALEAAAPEAPAMLTLTAAVNTSGDELLDMFNGNDW